MSKFRRFLAAKLFTEDHPNDIMMTMDSNPEVMRICYRNGFAKNKAYMTYLEALAVTDTSKFNSAFNNSDIVYFNEAKYFTGITGTVSFIAPKLLEFAFPPNCSTNIGRKFVNCYKYDMNVYNNTALHNGPEYLMNPKISEFIIDENNKNYGIIKGHLNKGEWWYRKSDGSKIWLIPNKDKEIIFPYKQPNGYASVSHTHALFQGDVMVSNNFYSGNASFANGGYNIYKIISFGSASYYNDYSYPSHIGQNVPSNITKEFIVSNSDLTLYESLTVYNKYLLNPNYCNFQLRRVNFGITIYHNELLSIFNGYHKDDFFMTLEECANITTLDNKLQNSNINTFKEFKYFTGLKDIEEGAFKNCIHLSDIILPNNIRRIEKEAFYNCEKLTEITIPTSVEYIGENAFGNCKKLSVIKFEGDIEPQIHPNAFGVNETIIGCDVNYHALFLPESYINYSTILEKLNNYNKVIFSNEIDINQKTINTLAKWVDGDELLYEVKPKVIYDYSSIFTPNLGKYPNIYLQDSNEKPSTFNIAITGKVQTTLALGDWFYNINILLKDGLISVVRDYYDIFSMYSCSLPKTGLSNSNNITLSGQLILKKYKHLDLNGNPKGWVLPFTDGLNLGAYDIINNKYHYITTKNYDINTFNFIETQGNIPLYIDTKYIVKDTDTIYLRVQFCLILDKNMGLFNSFYGWCTNGSASESVNLLVISPATNSTRYDKCIIRRGVTSSKLLDLYTSLYTLTSPNTIINTPTSIILNRTVKDDTTKWSNECYINGNSVLTPHIFGINDNGSNNYSTSKIRLFEYKIVNNLGNTTLLLLPHIDENGKACLKDTISGNLFYDENENDFIYGEFIEKVKILDTENYLWDPGFWDYSSTPVGVYVKTNDAEFIIAPEDANNGQLTSWGCNGLSIPGCAQETERIFAISDIDGYNNTFNILKESKDYTDLNNIIGSPTAEYCNNYIFANNERGYLPSLGEMVIAYKLKNKIDECLSIIGTKFKSDYYATSTRYNIGANRWDLRWSDGRITNSDSDGKWYIRPFSKVIGQVTEATTPSYIQSDGQSYFYLPDFNYNNCEIEFSVKYLQLTPDGNAFGDYNGSSRLETGVGWNGANYSVNYGNAGLKILNIIPDTNFHTFKVNKSGVYIDGELVSFSYYHGNASTYGVFNDNLSLRFFGTNRGSSARITPICLREWKCSRDGEVLIHLKPIQTDEGVGMIDVISGNIYYNEGLGNFKYC